MTDRFTENNIFLIKNTLLISIIISWFIYTGIGFNFKGTPIDISKIVILGTLLVFLYGKFKYQVNKIDIIFLIYIVSQVLFSIFYVSFYIQFMYLLYYILFYYLSYFIARIIFDKNYIFEDFIKYISYITIILLSIMIYLHVSNNYYFDNYRIAYHHSILEYSHTYKRIFNEIDMGNSFVGQFVNPNTSVQFLGMLMVFLLPYYLWKVNKTNIVLFSITSIFLIVSMAMTQSRAGLIIILMQFIILIIIRYKHSMKASIIFVGFLSILWLIDKNIVLYYFYLFTNLGTYIDQTKSLVESMPSEHLDRVYYYKLFFDYVIDSNLNFLFGYGPLVHKLNVNIRGITDLAWVFNTFLQVGLISISIYAVFYIKILNEAWKVYKINKLKYKGLFKYIIAVFLGMIVVSIPGYQAILNPVYFFMIGALVSLVYNHKIEINND